jgi:hypothetical protein
MRLIKRQDDSWQVDPYLNYLQQNAGAFPPGAREFAQAHWHYDLKHRQCPHDSWLQELAVIISASGSREQIRSTDIKSKYLGAYHDGYHHIEYKAVSSHSIDMRNALGDWIIDEVTLEDSDTVCHEIVFEEGTLIIRCEDLLYRWVSRP